jgi:hypothetical protein
MSNIIQRTRNLYIKQYLDNPDYLYLYQDNLSDYLTQAIIDGIIEESDRSNMYICKYMLTIDGIDYLCSLLIKKLINGYEIYDDYYIWAQDLTYTSINAILGLATEDSRTLVHSNPSTSQMLIYNEYGVPTVVDYTIPFALLGPTAEDSCTFVHSN